jgi:hypothetical protein
MIGFEGGKRRGGRSSSIRLTYSSVNSARPVRTSSEELVTPVRPFYDVLEVGLALRVDKRRHVRYIYNFRSI